MRFYIPIYWKFSIAIISIVIIFGTINLLLVKNSVYNTFENEIKKRGDFIAKSIADRAITPLLYDDVPALFDLIISTKKLEKNIAYIFIVNGHNKVIAHTFESNVPSELVNADKLLKRNKNILIIKPLNENKRIRDISSPIIDNSVGTIRIGLEDINFQDELIHIYNKFIYMIILFLIIGLSAAFAFSYFITNPIKKISKIAESLDIEKANFGSLDYFQKADETVIIEDEIDTLKLKFSEMTHRLQSAYSELKSTQESLFQSEKMASIGILSAGVCHEINNPITGIQSCLKRISKNPEDVAQNLKYIELMSEASNKIEEVVKGLLDFSRKYDFVFQSIDVVKVIDKIILLIDYELERNNIKVFKDYPDSNIIPNIHGNSNLLEQVFLNIILNAIDAINEKKAEEKLYEGEIKIVIYLKPSFLQIQINDNGIGVDEKNIQTIFDPFYTQKKIKKGTGLGLSICYKIIKEHNGEIFAKNNSDNGLSIIINFPI
ncbi:MAG: hypothetical protein A2046_15370 [Bacteroidetes bacterium GWA2_30_7]|nr:MAG: hypothetical protein A2046_15370 [Bacteroidetes bacterium GWA2_30_7]